MRAFLRRLAAKSRHAKARRAYAEAYAAYRAAEDRQDTRAMGVTRTALQAAHRALMIAEAEALPKPEPLPHPQRNLSHG